MFAQAREGEQELKRANEILKAASAFFGAELDRRQMIDFIDEHRTRWGVEPICRVLPIAPNTYYPAKNRPLSMRTLRDGDLQVEIWRVWDENFRVYGARKIWIALNRDGIKVASCTVARLMRQLGIRGAVRGKSYRTTWPTRTPASAPETSSSAPSTRRRRTGCGSQM